MRVSQGTGQAGRRNNRPEAAAYPRPEESKGPEKFPLGPFTSNRNGVAFDLSISDLARNQVPKPNRQDSVINGDDAHANRESAGRLAKAGVFALPVPRAEDNHQNGKQSGDGSDEADVVGYGFPAG